MSEAVERIMGLAGAYAGAWRDDQWAVTTDLDAREFRSVLSRGIIAAIYAARHGGDGWPLPLDEKPSSRTTAARRNRMPPRLPGWRVTPNRGKRDIFS